MIEFYPASNGEKFLLNGKEYFEPITSIEDRSFVPRAEIITIHKKWEKGIFKENENPYDFAGIILNQNISTNRKYFQLAHHNDNKLQGLEVSVTGYPSEKQTMHTMGGNIEEIDKHRVHYSIDTTGGQSGSPVWYTNNGNPIAAAVHIGSHHGLKNTGTKINKKIIKFMEKEWNTTLDQKE